MTALRLNKKNLNLNNNELTGDTYQVKNFIKTQLQGKWNADKKAWVVNVSEVEYWIEKGAITVHDAPMTSSKTTNGICPICKTYCYGDCKA